MEVTKRQYRFAVDRVNSLLPKIEETTATDDPIRTELEIMSAIVNEYESTHEILHPLTVAELIKYGLDKKKMTQRTLSKEVGISVSRISDFFRGRSEPSLAVIGRICKVLEIPTDIIMAL